MRVLTALIATLGTPAIADPDGYGHMMDWGYGFGMMLGPLIWLIILGFVIAGVIWMVRNSENGPTKNGASKALDELDIRFARGDIDADEYSARKKLLKD